MNFTITFPCKPLVRVFVLQNYGSPAHLYKDKGLMALVRLGLSRKDYHNNHIGINKDIYSANVALSVSEDDFNRYGGNLSYNTVMFLNQLFEDRLKKMMLSWCGAQYSYGMRPFDTICMFQSKFGYPEDVWKFESIYKYCQRKNAFTKEFRHEMRDRITKIVLENLSAQRTITKKAMSIYEED